MKQILLVRSAAAKMAKHKTMFTLSLPEYRAAQQLVVAAVDFVNEYHALHPRAKKMPRTFVWHGVTFRLQYSTLGRVFVDVPGCGARFPSEPFSV